MPCVSCLKSSYATSGVCTPSALTLFWPIRPFILPPLAAFGCKTKRQETSEVVVEFSALCPSGELLSPGLGFLCWQRGNSKGQTAVISRATSLLHFMA